MASKVYQTFILTQILESFFECFISINMDTQILKKMQEHLHPYFSSLSKSDALLSLLVSVSGYNNLETARAQGAFITEAHNRCSADTYKNRGR
jgi:hypothetical protein